MSSCASFLETRRRQLFSPFVLRSANRSAIEPLFATEFDICENIFLLSKVTSGIPISAKATFVPNASLSLTIQLKLNKLLLNLRQSHLIATTRRVLPRRKIFSLWCEALRDVQIGDSCKWNENLDKTGLEERGGKIIENVEETCLNLALVIIACQAQVAETTLGGDETIH